MILVIDKSKSAASGLADAFHTMGILANAITPNEAAREISHMYRAIVITSTHSIPDLREYIGVLKNYSAGIPIFAVGKVEEENKRLFLEVFPLGTYAADIIAKIQEACLNLRYPIPAHYTLAGIDASSNKRESTFFGDPLPFTKTENMILRCLIRSYPTEMPAETILLYAYRRDKMPEAPNIRTHICSLNKKFELIYGRPLIATTYGKGYFIMTPEKAECEELTV